MSRFLYEASVVLAATAAAISALSLGLVLADKPGAIVWILFATGADLAFALLITIGSAILLKSGSRWAWGARLALSIMFCVQILAVTLVSGRYDVNRISFALAAGPMCMTLATLMANFIYGRLLGLLAMMIPLLTTFLLCFSGDAYAAAVCAVEFAAVVTCCLAIALDKPQGDRPR